MKSVLAALSKFDFEEYFKRPGFINLEKKIEDGYALLKTYKETKLKRCAYFSARIE
jgi:hypothetical protein